MARLLTLIAFIALPAFAGPPQWYTQLYPDNSNTQITLTDANNTSITAVTNPTAATVKSNANTNTQPPTIIIQATGGLPIKTIGTACVSGTDTAALSAADKLTLLTCGAGNTWTITNRVALQTVVAGNACNVATDGNIAVDSSGIQLSCQGGRWLRDPSALCSAGTVWTGGACQAISSYAAAISAGGGKSQLWKAVAGQSISCAARVGFTGCFLYAYAQVDGNGNVWTRVATPACGGGDSGWVAGTKATASDGYLQSQGGGQLLAIADLGGVSGSAAAGGMGNIYCGGNWN